MVLTSMQKLMKCSRFYRCTDNRHFCLHLIYRGRERLYKPGFESPTSQSVYTPRGDDPVSMISSAVYTGYWSPTYELGDKR